MLFKFSSVFLLLLWQFIELYLFLLAVSYAELLQFHLSQKNLIEEPRFYSFESFFRDLDTLHQSNSQKVNRFIFFVIYLFLCSAILKLNYF